MTDRHHLQDVFLDRLRARKMPVTVFLINGVKLQGVVTGFDDSVLLLRRDSHAQLIYKNAISTVMPNAPMNLIDGEEALDSAEPGASA